jgi:hypothetical protein
MGLKMDIVVCKELAFVHLSHVMSCHVIVWALIRQNKICQSEAASLGVGLLEAMSSNLSSKKIWVIGSS